MIIQISKTDMSSIKIENVIQIDLSYLGNIEDEFIAKNEDWNFISILQYENGKKIRRRIELKDVLQFFVVGGKEDDTRR
jgi:hypothetical protein